MTMAEVVEQSLRADERFRHLTVFTAIGNFEIDFDEIMNSWERHVDSWLNGDVSLKPIYQFMVSQSISQMISNIANEMK